MPYIGGPFAVQSGQTLTLRPPENPGLLPYVVVMNEAPFSLSAGFLGASYYIPPITAALIPVPDINPPLIVVAGQGSTPLLTSSITLQWWAQGETPYVPPQLQQAATTIPYLSPGTYQLLVPAGVSSMTVDMAAGQGSVGSGTTSAGGGFGGRVQATLAVTPGHTLTVTVGDVGQASTIYDGATLLLIAGAGGNVGTRGASFITTT